MQYRFLPNTAHLERVTGPHVGMTIPQQTFDLINYDRGFMGFVVANEDGYLTGDRKLTFYRVRWQ